MLYSFALVAVVGSFVAPVAAGVVAPRDVCSTYSSALSVPANLAAAQTFCTQFLALKPVTSTVYHTSTVQKTTTAQSTTKVVATTTPATSTTAITSAHTGYTTATPATVTQTQPTTSTAYVDNEGNTIAIMKRTPTNAVKRAAAAVATPSFYKGLSKSAMTAACNCLDLAAPTYLRTMAAPAVTNWVTKVNMQTAHTTVVAPAPVTTSVVTKVVTLTITAPAPVATVFSTVFDDVNSCPPDSETTLVCPLGTGSDDGSDSDYLSCPVVADDGYSGDCLYWAEDGSPAPSTLSLGDGSGDADDNQTRDAIYGQDSTDDCPAWSDYTCSGYDDTTYDKRAFVERAMSKNSGTKTSLTHKKQAMPKGLKRGGHYRSAKELAAEKAKST